MKVGVNFWRGSGCPICDRLFFFFFLFCDEIKPRSLRSGERSRIYKTEGSRIILRHLTVKNDGGVKLRGINRKKSCLNGREVKIARV